MKIPKSTFSKRIFTTLVVITQIFYFSIEAYGKIQDNSNFTNDPACAWVITVDGFVPAYFDKGRNAYAINTVKQATDEWAAATCTFQQKSGTYEVIFTSLLETDGECSYKLFIDNEMVLSFKNPRIYGTDKKEYAPHEINVEKVKIDKGAEIRVEFLSNSNGLVPEGDAYGYARARWREIKFILKE